MMIVLFNVSLGAYLLAFVFGVAAMLVKRRSVNTIVTILLAVGAAVQAAYMALRWIEAGRAPFSNMFESLVLFAWAIVAVYLVVRIRINIPVLAAATALLATLVLAYASTFEMEIKPLMPALQSNWLSVHVFTCFLAYAGFAVSCLSAVGFLVGTRTGSKMNQDTRDALEIVVEKTVSFGFLFLTVGIITGAVWANSAWGSYWTWDPKETWSLVTWFAYAVFLHCRLMRGWRGRRIAWVSIAGFACVMFTYFGVNYIRIFQGLHSYS